MFFQWRAPRGGAERFHSALVPHAGPDSRVFREAITLGETLRRLSEVDAAAVDASVAIGWDAACWWALQGAGLPSGRLDYLDEVGAAHRVLWRAGIGCDFVGPGERLDAYRLVVLPALHLASDATAAAVRRYVAGGGHLVVSYLSGVADECARVRLGGYPGAFREVLGIRVEEFHPLSADDRRHLSAPDDGGPPAAEDGERWPSAVRGDAVAPPPEANGGAGSPAAGPCGRLWSETVRLAGARAVLRYADGTLAGQPAVTRHRYGAGVAWYVSTRLDDGAYGRLLAAAARAAGVAPACPGAPVGVEAVRRRTAGASWLFLLNHTDRPQPVPASGIDLVTGAAVDRAITVPAGGFAVLRESEPPVPT